MGKPIRVEHRKLGRHGVNGFYHVKERLIEIDPRLSDRKWGEVLLHELLHAVFPFMDEETVTAGAKDMNKVCWQAGLRRSNDVRE